MATPYDPLSSDVTEDVTINSVTYIVTDFNDSGDAANEVTFNDSDGAWRGRRMTTGERTANMTIQTEDAAQVTPPQFTVFPFRGHNWVIKNAGRTVSNSAAGTMALTLGWVPAVTP